MKNFIVGFVLAASTLVAAIVIAQPMSQHNQMHLPPELVGQMQRACIFPAGGWAEMDCSAGAATSSELTAWTRYIMQCTADSHIAFGASGMSDADASDGYLPTGEWLEFATTDSLLYASCDSSVGVGGGGKCYLHECM